MEIRAAADFVATNLFCDVTMPPGQHPSGTLDRALIFVTICPIKDLQECPLASVGTRQWSRRLVPYAARGRP
jgi:hypothetical protein